MDLLDTLRARCERRTVTEQVTCGGLGVLTAQALPLRECAALSAGADGDRAVLYAACRELQAAGETLRAEGTVFTPDEIMQMVSDEEAAAGADVVRRISGLSGQTEMEEPPDTKGQEELSPPEAPATAEKPIPWETAHMETAAEGEDYFYSPLQAAGENVRVRSRGAETDASAPNPISVPHSTSDGNPIFIPAKTPNIAELNRRAPAVQTHMMRAALQPGALQNPVALSGGNSAEPLGEPGFLGQEEAPRLVPAEEWEASTWGKAPEGNAPQPTAADSEQGPPNRDARRKKLLEPRTPSWDAPTETLLESGQEAEFDRRVARGLLEGLLRAAGAR